MIQPGYRADRPPFVELIDGTWTQTRNRSNDYLIDRELQASLDLEKGTGNYTGLASNRVEDSAIIESMGYLYDRSQEHLGSVDGAITYMRRMMIRAAKALENGIEPEILQHPEWFAARPDPRRDAGDEPRANLGAGPRRVPGAEGRSAGAASRLLAIETGCLHRPLWEAWPAALALPR